MNTPMKRWQWIALAVAAALVMTLPAFSQPGALGGPAGGPGMGAPAPQQPPPPPPTTAPLPPGQPGPQGGPPGGPGMGGPGMGGPQQQPPMTGMGQPGPQGGPPGGPGMGGPPGGPGMGGPMGPRPPHRGLGLEFLIALGILLIALEGLVVACVAWHMLKLARTGCVHVPVVPPATPDAK